MIRAPFHGTCSRLPERLPSSPRGLDAAGYRTNALIRSAVERQFEIIGEALNRLSKEAPQLADRVPNLRKIVRFRNVLIHGYAAGQVQLACSQALRRVLLD